MSANQFGNRFVVTTFGESHGVALGVVIDGCPAGVHFDLDLLKADLEKRRPGRLKTTSSRNELDVPEVLSGVFEKKTLGTPIAVIVRNTDQRSEDYDQIQNQARAGHADDVWKLKFGHSDHRGGGRSSGRETLCRVIAGSVAQMCLQQMFPSLKVKTQITQVGPLQVKADNAAEIEALLLNAKAQGESFGGIAQIEIEALPAGLGQPVFHKFKADLAAAMMSVGATQSVEIGDFADVSQPGTEFHSNQSQTQYGGIRGGISTGEKVIVQVTFKPTSSILDVAKKGRHDPCIVPRALPVLEAMARLVIMDHVLWQKTDRI